VPVSVLGIAGCIAPVKVLRSAAPEMPVTAGMESHHLRVHRQLVNLQAHGAVGFHALEIECHPTTGAGSSRERENDALVSLVLREQLDPHFARTTAGSARDDLVAWEPDHLLLETIVGMNVADNLSDEPKRCFEKEFVGVLCPAITPMHGDAMISQGAFLLWAEVG
jgi:hypothetical protein